MRFITDIKQGGVRRSDSESTNSACNSGYDTDMLVEASEKMEAASIKRRQPRRGSLKTYENPGPGDKSGDNASVFLPTDDTSDSESEAESTGSEDCIEGMTIKSFSSIKATKKDLMKELKKELEKVASDWIAANTSGQSTCSDMTLSSANISSISSRVESSASRRIKRAKCSNKKMTVTPQDSIQTKRCMRITDASMHPYSGSLRFRLDRGLSHFPLPVKKKHSNCQLHMWTHKIKYRKQMILCETCNVTLCVDCFKPFHVIPNLKNQEDDDKIEAV